MNLEELEKLIATKERDSLEFKKSTMLLKSAAQTLCGFLNNGGGVVLIGISDSGKIVGQHVTDNTRQEIARELHKFEPFSKIKTEYIDLPNSDKTVIVLTAHYEPDGIPYAYDGRAYERIDSTLIKMTQPKYHQLLLEKTLKPKVWEKLPASIGFSELDGEEIIDTIKEGIERGRFSPSISTKDPKEALIRLKLLNNNVVTNAAAVLFCKDPLPEYSQCIIRLIRYRGVEKGNFIDNKQIYGNTFVLLREAEAFLNRHISIAARFEPGKIQRIDEPTYPPKGVREAIINAISHRDYTIVGGAVTISIYDDRLEVISHGKLPNGIKIPDLKTKHESLPRNELIAHTLFRRGVIESVGTGTQEMIKSCKELGMKEPEFIEHGNTFSVIFKAKEDLRTIKISEEYTYQLTLRQKAIVELLQENNMLSFTDILTRLEKPPSGTTLKRDLSILKKHHIVDVRGKTWSAVWFLKGK